MPAQTASDVQSHPSQALSTAMLNVFMQVSVALGLVLLVRDLLTLAPLDHALLTAAGAGVVLYASLVGGYFVVRRILDAPPPAEQAEAPVEATPGAPAEAAPASSPEVPEAVAA